MGHGSEYDYWDRAELLENLKDAHQKLYGNRPAPGLYDDLEIKAIEAELSDLRGDILKEEIIFKNNYIANHCVSH